MGSPSLDRDKLHDMFSVLGLGEQEKWVPSNDSGIEMASTQAILEGKAEDNPETRQKKKLRSSKRGVTFKKNANSAAKESQKPITGQGEKGVPSRHSTPSYSAPEKIPNHRLCTNSEPLVTQGDVSEDDELLLTSKGWDWDPLYVSLVCIRVTPFTETLRSSSVIRGE
ncbi:hypothetical protein K439DRAFT_742122 [Ramaria rubella]|nr:hypothetical protein K439DRAFT_742122 [Ramaria rubella]